MNISLYPDEHEARQRIVETGKLMYNKNLVAATDGNISCKVNRSTLMVTPTAQALGFLSKDMLVELHLDGTLVDPHSSAPSSEIALHLRIYEKNPHVGAVVHAHPPAATAFAIAGEALDEALYPAALVNLGVVPCAPYETPGTQELADSILPYCNDHTAVLLANHGAVTWGPTLREAFYTLEALEHYAQILLNLGKLASTGTALKPDKVEELHRLRAQHRKIGGREDHA